MEMIFAWDVDQWVAPNDLGWPALQDRAVVDKMAEFLTVNERTQPPEETSDLAAQSTAQPPAGGPGRVRPDS